MNIESNFLLKKANLVKGKRNKRKALRDARKSIMIKQYKNTKVMVKLPFFIFYVFTIDLAVGSVVTIINPNYD